MAFIKYMYGYDYAEIFHDDPTSLVLVIRARRLTHQYGYPPLRSATEDHLWECSILSMDYKDLHAVLTAMEDNTLCDGDMLSALCYDYMRCSLASIKSFTPEQQAELGASVPRYTYNVVSLLTEPAEEDELGKLSPSGKKQRTLNGVHVDLIGLVGTSRNVTGRTENGLGQIQGRHGPGRVN